jgi:hypothetical protein
MEIDKIADQETALDLLKLNRNVVAPDHMERIFERFPDFEFRKLIEAYCDNYSNKHQPRMAAIFAAMKVDDIPYAVSTAHIEIAMLAAELYPAKAVAIIKIRADDYQANCEWIVEALARSACEKEIVEKAILDIAALNPKKAHKFAEVYPSLRIRLAEDHPDSAAAIARAFSDDALTIGKLSPKHAVEIVKACPYLEAPLQEYFKIES